MRYKIVLIADDDWEKERFTEWYPRGFKRSGLKMPKVESIEVIPPPENRGKWERPKKAGL